MKTVSIFVLLLLGYLPTLAFAEPDVRPIKHEIRDIEGWKVRVDVSLLEGEHESLGAEALRVLGDKLYQIAMRLPKDRVEKLREVPIFLDRAHSLRSMQYHPDARWLRRHQFDTAMTQAVHIPRADRLIRLIQTNQQPWVVLHELAHAYHDRVLGFKHPPILDTYRRAMKSGCYESVLHNRGRSTRHYALTDHKEYFAEMSEAYFGVNDFYPFVRAELQRVDPAAIEMLEKAWGIGP